MATVNKNFFREAQPSELAVFDLPPTQTAVENTYYQDVLPISQITNDSPVEFVVTGQNGLELVDLQNCLIYVKAKITKGNDAAIDDTEDVGPVNLLLPALFSQVDVTLQGKSVVSTTNHYAYKAYIQSLLKYGAGAKKSQLVTQLWLADTEGQMDANSPRTDSNTGLLNRAQMFKGGKSVDMVGPLYHDLFKMDRYLLNQVNVNVKLYRSKPEFCLMSGSANPDYKVVLEEIRLRVSKVKVNPAVIYAQSKALEMTTAKYPFTQTLVKQNTIASGSTSYTFDNIFQGMRPNLIVVGFVKATAATGSYEENPWYFQDFNVTSIGLYVDGIPVGGNPIKLKYSAAGGQTTIDVLRAMLQTTGKWQNDAGIDMDRDNASEGYALYAFELEPTFRGNQYLTLMKSGVVRLETYFGTALTEAVSCVVYAEYPGYFEINASRDIIVQ